MLLMTILLSVSIWDASFLEAANLNTYQNGTVDTGSPYFHWLFGHLAQGVAAGIAR
jgi:hypothetical protein